MSYYAIVRNGHLVEGIYAPIEAGSEAEAVDAAENTYPHLRADSSWSIAPLTKELETAFYKLAGRPA